MENQIIYERAERTLEAIRQGLPNINFGIVGSYSRHKLSGSEADDPFNVKSDIDIAVNPNLVPEVVSRLERRIGGNNSKVIPIGLYDGPKASQEYLVRSDLTPIHVVGSLSDQQIRHFTRICELNFLPTKPGLY